MEEVHFSSNQMGWICGGIDKGLFGDPVLLKTVDGGSSWRSINLSSLQVSKFITLYPANDSVLYACGPDISAGGFNSPRVLYKSVDGGDTWRKTVSPTYRTGSSALYFFNAQMGISATINSLQKTVDGGQTWRTVFDGGLVGLDKLQCFGSGTGYAAGGYGTDLTNDAGILLKTIDQGETWQNIPWANGTITTLSFLNEKVGFAGTLGQRLYKTLDGGTSWQKVDGLPPSTSNGVFLNEQDGYLAGLDVERTHDGGHTWQVEHVLPTNDACRNIGFSPNGTGIIITNKGLILKN
ncbi:WD40/YVTN/BNR-like repeat-containing protein [Hymenobacter caeli]|uniref:Photosystem II stability/assembly factor-like uncharacterized protein n=1 Tax=Hymenobacter caeli TaxID=2735894 RepID=A0ABX2FW14_9BACT|nr:hypothetical protein [Hymenobacter caeli]NRT21405.1 photosystem II stability/assembly factor-like uncharacterized protein [Hymenobacter caeli]